MVEQLQEEAGMFSAPPPIPQGSLQPPAALDNGPGTIESDDEVDNFSGSDSDDEIEVRRDAKESEFYKDFNFLSTAGDYQRDTWDEVLKYLKPQRSINISHTIARVRLEEKEKRKKKKEQKEKKEKEGEEEVKVKKEDGEEDSDLDFEKEEEEEEEEEDEDEEEEEEEEENSDGEFMPDPDTKDVLRQREDEVKRKERRKDRPVKIKKSLKELRQEENDAKFFEDAPPCQADTTFLEMNFSRSLLKAIDSLGYDRPTPIQAATIPVALQGRDVCGCAATGTGKTAAYMLPILERLLYKPRDDVVTRVLVVVPTRELGVQVFQVSKELSKYSHVEIALSVGGLDLTTQVAALKRIPDIVIATPGRLIDHTLNTPTFSLDSIEILVLDEADRMLDESFEDQMKEIIHHCSGNRQTLLFSATMTSQVKELAMVSLKNPVKVFVNENTDVAQNLRQEFVRLRKHLEGQREAALAYLVSRSFRQNCMVFVETKAMAHHLNILLGLLGIKAGELHGNLKQTDRLLALKKFRDQEVDVLIATDVAARGLDIKGVKTVINYTLPSRYTRYVHRVGRTARAGHCGRSVSLAGEKEFPMLKEIKKCSRSAMFERVLNKDVLAKYVSRVQRLGPAVKRVMQEEQQEKQLAAMEQSIRSMEKRLQDTEKEGEEDAKPQRTWFQTDEEIKQKTKKRALKGKALAAMERAKRRQKNRKDAEDPEEKRVRAEVGWAQRKAKRDSKPKRLALQDDVDAPVRVSAGGAGGGGGRKRKKGGAASSFDQELTRTDRRSVKKFRAGPSYQERREAFQDKNPGKKFNPRGKKK
ncbi:probable ATP-dependent RNA helicase DDX27 isoform X2 [Portunus trituberculatus]|uniref:probable ATP-dependent RNA helicase DDX27 isoform X2 n=1 Tax=Portunus trituberculatus TaxID=210409 RepID=UPI001E1CBB20|nr:probable ATP-dependent RNA helicase DDX27 isoform X2 [Portunus trituberculatus]